MFNRRVIVWLVVIGSTLFQLLVLLLVAKKGGGTTGFDPFHLIPLFFLLAVVGVMLRVLWCRNLSERKASSLLAIIGGFGSILPLFLHLTGSLVYYERWTGEGMKSLSDNPSGYLLIFGGALLSAMGVALLMESRLWRGQTET